MRHHSVSALLVLVLLLLLVLLLVLVLVTRKHRWRCVLTMTFVEYEHEYEYEESVRYIVTRMGPGGEGSAGRKEAHKLCGHPRRVPKRKSPG